MAVDTILLRSLASEEARRNARSVRHYPRKSHSFQTRGIGELFLCAYAKRLRSNFRSDESAVAESWKLMHVCA
jgi:hypothetical protein